MPGIVSIMTRHRENGPEGHLFRRPELQSDDEAGCPIELKGEETTLLLLSAGGGGGARPPRFFWGVMGAKPLCKPPPAGGFLYSKNHACQIIMQLDQTVRAALAALFCAFDSA